MRTQGRVSTEALLLLRVDSRGYCMHPKTSQTLLDMVAGLLLRVGLGFRGVESPTSKPQLRPCTYCIELRA